MADEPDDLDIEISLSPEQAERPLSAGEFIEVITMTNNRLTLQALATANLASGDLADFIEKMTEALNMGSEIGATLKSIATNSWVPRSDD